VLFWLDFVDPWGNRHLIGLAEFSCPGGGSIFLLAWVIFPAGSTTPVIVLAELLGTTDLFALRQHVESVADDVLPLLVEQVPELVPAQARWLVHSGPFSTPEGTLPETFHEVRLTFDGLGHQLEAVRMLGLPEIREMIAALKLRPISEILDRFRELHPEWPGLPHPQPPGAPEPVLPAPVEPVQPAPPEPVPPGPPEPVPPGPPEPHDPGRTGTADKPRPAAAGWLSANGGPEDRPHGPDVFLPPSAVKLLRSGDDGGAVRWLDRVLIPAPPVSEARLAQVQARLGVRLPEDYLDVVRIHQGGAPDRDMLTLPDGTETSFSALLHFEDEPAELNLVHVVESSDALYGKLIPFAVDRDGNYFCFDYRGETSRSSAETRWNRPVVLVAADNPVGEPQSVAAGFSELLDSLRGVVATSR